MANEGDAIERLCVSLAGEGCDVDLGAGVAGAVRQALERRSQGQAKGVQRQRRLPAPASPPDDEPAARGSILSPSDRGIGVTWIDYEWLNIRRKRVILRAGGAAASGPLAELELTEVIDNVFVCVPIT